MSSMRSALRARLAEEKDAAQPSRQPASSSSSSSSSRRSGETILEGRFYLRESDASEPTRGTSSATSSPTPRGGLSRWAHRQKGAAAGSTPLAPTSSSGSGSGKGSLRSSSSSSKKFGSLADTPTLAPSPSPSPLCPTAASGSRRGSTSTSSRHSDTSSFMGSPRMVGSPRVLRRGTSLLGEVAPQPASVLFRSLKLESMVGEGRYGTVWRCVDPKTGLQYACKQVDKRRNPKSLKREVECLTRVQSHEGVLRLEGVYESELYLYIVTELCDKGDLFEYLSKQGPLQESNAKELFRQLAKALYHCHARGVMHRDIKPENVLLKHSATSSQPSAKLADFGLSKLLRPGEMTVGWVGSDPYEAPEVLALQPYNFSADVFSLGVVLFGMLSGTWPTFKEGRSFDAEGEFAWPGWRRISQEARDLLAGMLSHDPSARPTMEDVVTDPWLTCTTPAVAVAPSALMQKALSSNGRVQQQPPQQQQQNLATEGEGITGEAMPLRPRALQLARAISHSQVSSSDCASETCSRAPSPAVASSNGVAKGVAHLIHENSLSDVSWAGSELSSPQSCSEGARLSFELNRQLTIT